MISNNFSIDEFVESAKGKSSWEVLSLAVEEANSADRMVYKSDRPADSQRYSRHLKRLINYLRYETIPKRPQDRAYQLYMSYWAESQGMHPDLLLNQPTDGSLQSMY